MHANSFGPRVRARDNGALAGSGTVQQPQNPTKMKLSLKLFASTVTLLAACLVQAADSKPIARVIVIQDIETEDASGYATWLAKTNAVVKTKLGIDNFYHVYVSQYDGVKTGAVRTVAVADSVATLAKVSAALENDPVVLENRDHLRALRKQGARTLYQAVRFDGTTKNGFTYTTLANVTDEAGYLKALDQLRALFDGRGFQDSKINVYRVLAGRANHTHRVTIASPNAERQAALLDMMAGDSQMAAWIADSAKYRTVVSNGTAREITK